MAQRPLIALLVLALSVASSAPAAAPEGWISPSGPASPVASGPRCADRSSEWRVLAGAVGPVDLGLLGGGQEVTPSDLAALEVVLTFTPTLDLDRFLAERPAAAGASAPTTGPTTGGR